MQVFKHKLQVYFYVYLNNSRRLVKSSNCFGTQDGHLQVMKNKNLQRSMQLKINQRKRKSGKK